MKTTQKRAAKGGEIGANGEWYEGGTFINTTPENAKRYGSGPKSTGKQEIEPYVWQVAPQDGLRSIYKAVNGTVARWQDGKLTLRTDGGLCDTLAYLGLSHEHAANLVNRYNAGDRWATQSEIYG